jgi:hypothetical protein
MEKTFFCGFLHYLLVVSEPKCYYIIDIKQQHKIRHRQFFLAQPKTSPGNVMIRVEKDFSRSYSSGEWELRLRLYTRGGLDEGYQQKYAAVIEVIDLSSSTDVYHDINSEFTGLYQAILIKMAA